MRWSFLCVIGEDSVAESAAAPRLVVGLGNPGGQYLATRHNAGFEVVELLAARAGVKLRRGKFRCARAEARIVARPDQSGRHPGPQGLGAGARVILIQPHTFVNLSGRAVQGAVNYYKVPLSRLLVVCDDVHLPVGKIRLRRSGGPGGHNGLSSIIEALGSEEFPRLRVGVGEPPPYVDQVTYVLSRFNPEEREEMAAAIARAADAVEVWIAAGIEEAMNRFN
jgi:PTH1 family peptidyl-tRNA hydrolase